MQMLENRIPPLAVVGLCASGMWALAGFPTTFLSQSNVIIVIAVTLLALGICFALAGVMSFSKAHTTVDPMTPEAASRLVTTGIYRVTRNPMYVGFALCLAAWGTYLASYWPWPAFLGFVIYITRFQILPEEAALSRRFGSEFNIYREKVRRWL